MTNSEKELNDKAIDHRNIRQANRKPILSASEYDQINQNHEKIKTFVNFHMAKLIINNSKIFF